MSCLFTQHCFVGSCHSSPENVFRSLASRIKSRAQANKLDRCLDSYLPTILCSSTALSWNRQWLGAGTGKQTDWRIDPSAGFFKKFGWLNHIFGWYPAQPNFCGSYGIRLKMRPNTTNSANKTDKLRQSNSKYKQHNKGVWSFDACTLVLRRKDLRTTQ